MSNILESRAAFYYKNKKYLSAAKCYLRLIKNSSKASPETYLALAACYYNIEEYEKCISVINKFILLRTDDTYDYYAYAWKAMALMMLKRFREGYKIWEKLNNTGEDFHDESYYFCGASCCNELGMYEKALEYINKSIFLKKQDSHNYILKGRILANLGKSELAEKMFKKADNEDY